LLDIGGQALSRFTLNYKYLVFMGGDFVEYVVEVVIESKPAAKDPEGATIVRDLMGKEGYGMVREVRTGKLLRVTIEAKSEEEASSLVDRMCNELRLANPVAQNYKISVMKG
jgi:phosphoribosylformylglycinamidine synthase subunit PurS